MKKKSQLSELISISLIIIVLVIVLVFSRIRSARYSVTETEAISNDYKNIYSKTAPYLFLQITVKKETLSKLFGYYTCYNETDFKISGISYNVISETQRELNDFFGKNKWSLQIQRTLCIDSETSKKGFCETFNRKNINTYEFVYPLPCKTDYAAGIIYLYFD
ncbi:hypothetical protein GF327_08670 [Candidatus Woesearchaeota archaeon]|nr:hypothetical protein [Candidatus Woesearchaeota archaeon]